MGLGKVRANKELGGPGRVGRLGEEDEAGDVGEGGRLVERAGGAR